MFKKCELYKIRAGLLFTLLVLCTTQIHAQNLTWHSFEQALAKADSGAKHILVDVGAPWCGWCHKMKEDVYPALAPLLNEHFVLTNLNRDDHKTTHRYKGQKFTSMRLAQKLKAASVPTVVFLTPDGDYLLHISGFTKAKNLRPLLKYIATNAYRKETYETFRKKMVPNFN